MICVNRTGGKLLFLCARGPQQRRVVVAGQPPQQSSLSVWANSTSPAKNSPNTHHKLVKNGKFGRIIAKLRFSDNYIFQLVIV
jgi:hypothetical protein